MCRGRFAQNGARVVDQNIRGFGTDERGELGDSSAVRKVALVGGKFPPHAIDCFFNVTTRQFQRRADSNNICTSGRQGFSHTPPDPTFNAGYQRGLAGKIEHAHASSPTLIRLFKAVGLLSNASNAP